MGEEKVKERRLEGLMDNILKHDDGYQITIGRRAGFGDDEQHHFYITLPKSTSEDVLRHINDIMHNAIHRARRDTREDMQHQLRTLIGAE